MNLSKANMESHVVGSRLRARTPGGPARANGSSRWLRLTRRGTSAPSERGCMAVPVDDMRGR